MRGVSKPMAIRDRRRFGDRLPSIQFPQFFLPPQTPHIPNPFSTNNLFGRHGYMHGKTHIILELDNKNPFAFRSQETSWSENFQ